MRQFPCAALAVVLIACQRERPATEDTRRPDSSFIVAAASLAPANSDSAIADRARADSAAFDAFLDSVRILTAELDSVGTAPAAAPILFRIGQLKRHADRWMYYSGPGWEYAAALRDEEYWADEANARFIYKGTDWRRLIQLFPDDTLADEAAWGIAHNDVEGDCEGSVPCYLSRDFVPVLEFLMQFPHSTFDSAAVAEANLALTTILDRVPDLNVADTVKRDYDPAWAASLLSRYDSAAARLAPTLRAQVQAVTGPLWTRLGKPRT